MMPLLYPLELAAVLVLGYLLWKHGADQTVAQNRRARMFSLVGLVILGLNAAFYLLFAVGETISGDFSGLAHLLPFALAALLAFLAWKSPLDGGIALIILGILGTILSPPILRGDFTGIAYTLIFSSGPLLLAGMFFLAAGLSTRRSSSTQPA
jgi:hypothetical protein